MSRSITSTTAIVQHAPPHGGREDIELPQLAPRDAASYATQEASSAESTTTASISQLAPVDGGRAAWTVLIAGFVFEALFWGFPTCWGVFQDYYTRSPQFSSSPSSSSSSIALVGTLAQGLYFMGAPFSATTTRLFPRWQRVQIYVGWVVCILGLLCASFAEGVGGLIATQGVLYGLGFVTLTYPILGMLNEWWVVRKGMAFGLISAASGATGAVMPFVLEGMLRRWGYRVTLRASAVFMAVVTAPLLPLFKPRLPVGGEQVRLPPVRWGFVGEKLFWVYAMAVLVQGVGFFYPAVFLPSFATEVGLSSTQGAALLAVMCVAQVGGQFAFGNLSDRKPVGVLSVTACVVAGAATLLLWGFGAKGLGALVPFSVLFGFFAFGFVTMRVAMARAMSDDPSTVFVMYTVFVCIMGVGNLLVGPISGALMGEKEVQMGEYAVGRYTGMVALTGVSSLVAAAIVLCQTWVNRD